MSPGDMPEQALARLDSLVQNGAESCSPLGVVPAKPQRPRERSASEAHPVVRLSSLFWSPGPDEGPAAA